mgnify:CR=1 FL=1
MTAEMELEDLKQLCQFQAEELEIKDNQLRQTRDILESMMQEIDDKRIKSKKLDEELLLFNQWNGLNQFKRELDKIIGGEIKTWAQHWDAVRLKLLEAGR